AILLPKTHFHFGEGLGSAANNRGEPTDWSHIEGIDDIARLGMDENFLNLRVVGQHADRPLVISQTNERIHVEPSKWTSVTSDLDPFLARHAACYPLAVLPLADDDLRRVAIENRAEGEAVAVGRDDERLEPGIR